MFVTRRLYLIGDSSHEDYWIKVINVFVSALDLNRLRMHNEFMHIHCPIMLMWCSLLLLVVIKEINTCAVHTNFSCKCLQTREIFKDTQQELQNTCV